MRAVTQRSAFTLRQLLAAVMILAALMAVALPRLVWNRETARREECVQKLRQIGIALQNHHDSFKYFPKLSTEDFPQTPGGKNAGFSWICRIIPYMEAYGLYNGMPTASNKFAPIRSGGVSAFNPRVSDTSGRHYGTVQLDALICPSFTGRGISDQTTGIYAATLGINPKSNPPIGVAISNYVAIPATHIALMRTATSSADLTDGVLRASKGANLRTITDGLSNTVMVCESRERGLNAWIDGSVNWVVGADPNNATAPTITPQGLITLPAGAGTALNVGPSRRTPNARYLTSANSPNGYEWAWGPSSEHPGIVLHVYADASVRAQSDTINPTVYLRLITRAGADPVVDPGVAN